MVTAVAITLILADDWLQRWQADDAPPLLYVAEPPEPLPMRECVSDRPADNAGFARRVYQRRYGLGDPWPRFVMYDYSHTER